MDTNLNTRPILYQAPFPRPRLVGCAAARGGGLMKTGEGPPGEPCDIHDIHDIHGIHGIEGKREACVPGRREAALSPRLRPA